MSYKIKYTSASKKDYEKLDNSQKLQIRKSLKKIEEFGLDTGQPLRGKLADCKKMKHKKLGLRVIFKQSDLGIEIIEIVVIGKRNEKEVYREAEKRLGR
ncbi:MULTISPECIES: type II toxin-antitoxin system RelE family toxin [Enterococcus]|uniref:Addiction module toxin RelE n=1 Tax=Enterococcus mundtii TaxID=53346 RepID=A0A848N010_ENTMU|nr:addiction module toxin RelE [Enterococcus mundtii]NMP59578.1 addiction module toxin RelE [Enterococcus mundtii]BBM16379.1 RelE protein [Enterococcus mundtii]SFM44528.1 mRNA interferase RelE/StbE [Enterococcus mundtii]